VVVCPRHANPVAATNLDVDRRVVTILGFGDQA
jgi:hypothetical protein